MNLIAAVDKNWGIGKNNQLLVRIPMDQKFFRETTTGKVVVTHNPGFRAKGALVVHSLEELREKLSEYDSNDIYVIGGESIYRQLLDECDTAHITKINYAYDADAYFPDLDARPEWRITADSEEQTYFDLEFFFYKYEKVK